MYKKYASYLLVLHMIVLVNIGNADLTEEIVSRGLDAGLRYHDDVWYEAENDTLLSEQQIQWLEQINGDERVVECYALARNFRISVAEEEIEILARIVEAEAGGEDLEGKMLVANVVINRVLDDNFPDCVRDVVFQEENGVYQFSPISDGRYYSVTVSEESLQAAYQALLSADNSGGALYFVARKAADSDKLEWFDENLTYLFAHGGHDFFR